MGLGPVHAATPILKRHGLGLNDLDYWEINEAFAAQVLGCLAAWKDEKYCREELGLDGALGALDDEKLNVDGGAIALGHPVGASGARIVLHLLKVLKRNNAKRGMASHLHRRRPRRRDAGGGALMDRADACCKHWRWEKDARRPRLADLRQAGRVGQHLLARGAGGARRRRSTRSNASAQGPGHPLGEGQLHRRRRRRGVHALQVAGGGARVRAASAGTCSRSCTTCPSPPPRW